MVCDRHGGHFLAGCFIEQFAGLAGPVEQAEIRVNV